MKILRFNEYNALQTVTKPCFDGGEYGHLINTVKIDIF